MHRRATNIFPSHCKSIRLSGNTIYVIQAHLMRLSSARMAPSAKSAPATICVVRYRQESIKTV